MNLLFIIFDIIKMQAYKRLQQELKEINDNYNEEEFNIYAGPKDDENIFEWEVSIQGPEDSPYEGGTFHFEFFFPKDYPFKSPKIICQTPIFHPNFNQNKGAEVCCHTLDIKNNWDIRIKMIKLLKDIQSLLKSPNPDAACDWGNQEAVKLYRNDKYLFEITAKEWTEKYAMEN